MLEARHLRKTYKTKRGAETKALDDVSVTFAEKGMVFILGKSGSGNHGRRRNSHKREIERG